MLGLLRQRNFALLWFGQLVSVVGDLVLFVALPFYVYERTGSALATSAMFVVLTLPTLLLGSVAGVFADRWDRRRTMIAADLARGTILLPLLLVNPAENLWMIYVIGFAESCVSQFFLPAKSALLPRLVAKEDLTAANSLDGVGVNFARLVGPSLGGAMMGLVGLGGVVLLDAASYVVSAAMILMIQPSPLAPARTSGSATAASAWGGFWGDWLGGLRVVKDQAGLRMLFLVMGLGIFADGILSALLIPYVKDTLQVGAREFGWVVSSRGLGGLLGGVAVVRLGKSAQSVQLVWLGLVGLGALVLLLVNQSSLAVALLLMLLVGFPAMAFMVGAQTLLQTLVADEYRGRVSGACSTTIALAAVAGMGGAGAAAELLSARVLLNLSGGLFLIAGIVSWMRLVGKQEFSV